MLPDFHPDNKYWIGLDLESTSAQAHTGDAIVLGRECTSISDLAAVAADLRADLEVILDEARKKLARSRLSPLCD
jgi:hypothetical protein